MNYKTISPPRAQRPSKQTNQELATKIIRMVNQIKHQYKTHYYYAIAKALSIRVKWVQVCLKKATAGAKNIFNHRQPWKTSTRYYYDIRTWTMNVANNKVRRNQKNTARSLAASAPVLKFIKDYYNDPLMLELANGHKFAWHPRRSGCNYLHQYERIKKQAPPVRKSTIYRHIKHNRMGYKRLYFVRLYKGKRMLRLKNSFPKLPFQTIDHQAKIPQFEPNHFQADTVIGKSTDAKALATMIDVNTGRVTIDLYDRKAASFVRIIAKRNGKGLKSLRIDNGSENAMLHHYLPQNRIFTCHPYSSLEKGAIESMHRLIRMVWPKGKSMDLLTDKAVMVIEEFVNSYYRARYIR